MPVAVVEAGTVIADRWTVVDRIDGGAMSDIYRARDAASGDLAAVKVLQRRYLPREDAVQRFLREARVTKGLVHPRIVTVRGHGLHDALPFLAMESLHGEPLEARMARAPLSRAELLSVGRQVAEALDAAHAAGVVHRDVKPDNIFVLEGDGPIAVKVLDFGFAKITDRFAEDGLRTASNALLGSPLYMAPEQVRASRGVDARADLWSLAVVLYELLTGSAPFGATGTTALLVQVVSAPIPPPSTKQPSLPAAVDAWCVRALARDPTARFPTAGAMVEALAEALGERTAAESTAAPPTSPAARWRLAVGLGVALTVVLALVLVFGLR